MKDERKDAVTQIRLSSGLLSKFKSKCEKSTPKIIPAEWLRDRIEDFVKDSEK